MKLLNNPLTYKDESLRENILQLKDPIRQGWLGPGRPVVVVENYSQLFPEYRLARVISIPLPIKPNCVGPHNFQNRSWQNSTATLIEKVGQNEDCWHLEVDTTPESTLNSRETGELFALAARENPKHSELLIRVALKGDFYHSFLRACEGWAFEKVLFESTYTYVHVTKVMLKEGAAFFFDIRGKAFQGPDQSPEGTSPLQHQDGYLYPHTAQWDYHCGDLVCRENPIDFTKELDPIRKLNDEERAFLSKKELEWLYNEPSPTGYRGPIKTRKDLLK